MDDLIPGKMYKIFWRSNINKKNPINLIFMVGSTIERNNGFYTIADYNTELLSPSKESNFFICNKKFDRSLSKSKFDAFKSKDYIFEIQTGDKVLYTSKGHLDEFALKFIIKEM